MLPILDQHFSDLSEFGKLSLSGKVPVTGRVGEQASQMIRELVSLKSVPAKPERRAA